MVQGWKLYGWQRRGCPQAMGFCVFCLVLLYKEGFFGWFYDTKKDLVLVLLRNWWFFFSACRKLWTWICFMRQNHRDLGCETNSACSMKSTDTSGMAMAHHQKKCGRFMSLVIASRKVPVLVNSRGERLGQVQYGALAPTLLEMPSMWQMASSVRAKPMAWGRRGGPVGPWGNSCSIFGWKMWLEIWWDIGSPTRNLFLLFWRDGMNTQTSDFWAQFHLNNSAFQTFCRALWHSGLQRSLKQQNPVAKPRNMHEFTVCKMSTTQKQATI